MIYGLIFISIAALAALVFGVIVLLERRFDHAPAIPSRRFERDDRWPAWLLISLPLVLGVIMGWVYVGDDRYADMGARARAAKPFVIEGKLATTGRRGRYITIERKGARRAISCKLDGDRAACVRGAIELPQDVQAKVFDYNGSLILLELRLADGELVLTEADRLRSIDYFAKTSADSGFGEGLMFGGGIGIIMSLFLGTLKLRGSRRRISSPAPAQAN